MPAYINELCEGVTVYDNAGNQTAVIDANGNRSETLYDSMNRAIQTTTADPDGIAGPLASPISTQTYDRSGNLVATTDPIGRQTRYLYDSRNRLVKTILPDGTEQLNRYDFDNNPVSRRDANGEATQSIYDARGRLVAMVDESGDRTQFVYDAANQMTAQIDANGVRTEYTYDDLGRRITMTSAARTTTTITTTTEYDKVGNTLAQTDGLGQRTEMEYDNLDRLILTRDAADPAGETTYIYDAAGNLLSLNDAVNNNTIFTYDARSPSSTESLVLAPSPLTSAACGTRLSIASNVFGKRLPVLCNSTSSLVQSAALELLGGWPGLCCCTNSVNL